jgi:hypothetical protein
MVEAAVPSPYQESQVTLYKQLCSPAQQVMISQDVPEADAMHLNNDNTTRRRAKKLH